MDATRRLVRQFQSFASELFTASVFCLIFSTLYGGILCAAENPAEALPARSAEPSKPAAMAPASPTAPGPESAPEPAAVTAEADQTPTPGLYGGLYFAQHSDDIRSTNDNMTGLNGRLGFDFTRYFALEIEAGTTLTQTSSITGVTNAKTKIRDFESFYYKISVPIDPFVFYLKAGGSRFSYITTGTVLGNSVTLANTDLAISYGGGMDIFINEMYNTAVNMQILKHRVINEVDFYSVHVGLTQYVFAIPRAIRHFAGAVLGQFGKMDSAMPQLVTEKPVYYFSTNFAQYAEQKFNNGNALGGIELSLGKDVSKFLSLEGHLGFGFAKQKLDEDNSTDYKMKVSNYESLLTRWVLPYKEFRLNGLIGGARYTMSVDGTLGGSDISNSVTEYAAVTGLAVDLLLRNTDNNAAITLAYYKHWLTSESKMDHFTIGYTQYFHLPELSPRY
jgi:hypothetical protein